MPKAQQMSVQYILSILKKKSLNAKCSWNTPEGMKTLQQIYEILSLPNFC